MPWLFRVYSDSSHASNGPTGFAPAAAVSRGGNVNAYHAPAFLEDMRAQLMLAMSGRKTAPHNPFIFFTPSLLLALLFAHFRNGGFYNGIKEQNIRITCFDSDQARTPHGEPVQCTCLEELTQKHGIENIDNGVRRSYLAEYVTMDCVVLDNTARTAFLDDIISQGLYRLYPAIQEVTNNTKFAPRVNMELQKLRKFSFLESIIIRPCDPARIDLAAKIAATFKTVDRSNELVAGHTLAWMLSLTKRDAGGQRAISEWLDENSFARPSEFMELDAGFVVDTTTMPEVSQFHEILPMMSSLGIGNQVLAAKTSISAKDNQKEILDWRDEQQVNNAEYQEARKIKQAAKAVVEKEKNAVKKAKVTKKKEAEATRKRKDREKAQKKKAVEKEAKEKRKVKAAKNKITAEKEKAKRVREKAKLQKEKEKSVKEKAKQEKQKVANEKVKVAAEKKMQRELSAKDKKIKELEELACPEEYGWFV